MPLYIILPKLRLYYFVKLMVKKLKKILQILNLYLKSKKLSLIIMLLDGLEYDLIVD